MVRQIWRRKNHGKPEEPPHISQNTCKFLGGVQGSFRISLFLLIFSSLLYCFFCGSRIRAQCPMYIMLRDMRIAYLIFSCANRSFTWRHGKIGTSLVRSSVVFPTLTLRAIVNLTPAKNQQKVGFRVLTANPENLFWWSVDWTNVEGKRDPKSFKISNIMEFVCFLNYPKKPNNIYTHIIWGQYLYQTIKIDGVWGCRRLMWYALHFGPPFCCANRRPQLPPSAGWPLWVSLSLLLSSVHFLSPSQSPFLRWMSFGWHTYCPLIRTQQRKMSFIEFLQMLLN